MSLLAQRFRREANELLEASQLMRLEESMRVQLTSLLGLTTVDELHAGITRLSESLPTQGDWVQWCTVAVAQVNANTLNVVADVLEIQGDIADMKSRVDKREVAADFRYRIAQAASAGNWGEYDRLVKEHSEQLSNGDRVPIEAGFDGDKEAAAAE